MEYENERDGGLAPSPVGFPETSLSGEPNRRTDPIALHGGHASGPNLRPQERGNSEEGPRRGKSAASQPRYRGRERSESEGAINYKEPAENPDTLSEGVDREDEGGIGGDGEAETAAETAGTTVSQGNTRDQEETGKRKNASADEGRLMSVPPTPILLSGVQPINPRTRARRNTIEPESTPGKSRQQRYESAMTNASDENNVKMLNDLPLELLAAVLERRRNGELVTAQHLWEPAREATPKSQPVALPATMPYQEETWETEATNRGPKRLKEMPSPRQGPTPTPEFTPMSEPREKPQQYIARTASSTKISLIDRLRSYEKDPFNSTKHNATTWWEGFEAIISCGHEPISWDDVKVSLLLVTSHPEVSRMKSMMESCSNLDSLRAEFMLEYRTVQQLCQSKHDIGNLNMTEKESIREWYRRFNRSTGGAGGKPLSECRVQVGNCLKSRLEILRAFTSTPLDCTWHQLVEKIMEEERTREDYKLFVQTHQPYQEERPTRQFGYEGARPSVNALSSQQDRETARVLHTEQATHDWREEEDRSERPRGEVINTVCFRCGGFGHYAKHCSEPYQPRGDNERDKYRTVGNHQGSHPAIRRQEGDYTRQAERKPRRNYSEPTRHDHQRRTKSPDRHQRKTRSPDRRSTQPRPPREVVYGQDGKPLRPTINMLRGIDTGESDEETSREDQKISTRPRNLRTRTLHTGLLRSVFEINGEKLIATYDTGATHTVCNPNHLRPGTIVKDPCPVEGKMRLETFNEGQVSHIDGFANIVLTLPNGKRQPWRVMLCTTLHETMLLGQDFLRKNEVMAGWNNMKSVVRYGLEEIPHLTPGESVPQISLNTMAQIHIVTEERMVLLCKYRVRLEPDTETSFQVHSMKPIAEGVYAARLLVDFNESMEEDTGRKRGAIALKTTAFKIERRADQTTPIRDITITVTNTSKSITITCAENMELIALTANGESKKSRQEAGISRGTPMLTKGLNEREEMARKPRPRDKTTAQQGEETKQKVESGNMVTATTSAEDKGEPKRKWYESQEQVVRFLQSTLVEDPEAKKLWTKHGSHKTKAPPTVTPIQKEGSEHTPGEKSRHQSTPGPKPARRVQIVSGHKKRKRGEDPHTSPQRDKTDSWNTAAMNFTTCSTREDLNLEDLIPGPKDNRTANHDKPRSSTGTLRGERIQLRLTEDVVLKPLEHVQINTSTNERLLQAAYVVELTCNDEMAEKMVQFERVRVPYDGLMLVTEELAGYRKLPLQLTNFTMEIIRLRAGTHIANAQTVTDIEFLTKPTAEEMRVTTVAAGNDRSRGETAMIQTVSLDETQGDTAEQSEQERLAVEEIKTMGGYPPITKSLTTLDHLDDVTKAKVEELIEKFTPTVFPVKDQALSFSLTGEHNLRLDAKPEVGKQYPLSHAKRIEMIKQVTAMLKDRTVEPAQSPFNSPVILVKKSDGSWRMVMDFRKLNAVTVTDRYPMSNPGVLYRSMSGMVIFTTMDMVRGFWQIKMAKEDRDYTAFSVPGVGQFRWIRMPFGLKNAPATFNRIVTAAIAGVEKLTLHGLLVSICVAFVDDLAIASKDLASHLRHIELLLEALQVAKLVVNMKKCTWIQTSIKFLGHVISSDGLKLDPARIKRVEDWKVPTNRKAWQRFLGFANYCRDFIPNYAYLAAPLYILTKAHNTQPVTEIHEEAFKKLKTAFSSPTMLSMPEYGVGAAVFVITADACEQGIGGILQQEQNGVARTIAYCGRALTDAAELQDWITIKECMAITFALESFKIYYDQCPIQVITDHKALTWLMTKADLSRNKKLYHMALCIQEALPNIEYIKGASTSLIQADALSRCTMTEEPEEYLADRAVPMGEETPGSMSWGDGIPEASELPREINSMSVDQESYEVWTRGPGSRDLSNQEMNEWAVFMSATTDAALTITYLNLADEQRKDVDLSPFFTLIEEDKLENPLDQHQETNLRARAKLHTIQNNLLLLKGRVVVPKSLRPSFLVMAHVVTGAHQGIAQTTRRLQSFIWRDMTKDIRNTVTNCITCHSNKEIVKRYQPTLLERLTVPYQAMVEICMDMVGPIAPVTERGNRFILVLICSVTRWIEAFPMKDASATTVANIVVKDFICRHGAPVRFLTDNGSNFTAEVVAEVNKIFRIQHHRAPPYSPFVCGKVERSNGMIMTMLARLCVDCPQNWDELLPFVLFAHRTAVSRATDVSPYEMMFGRNANTPMEATLWAGIDSSTKRTPETTSLNTTAVAYRQHLAETLLFTFDYARRHELEHYRPVTKPPTGKERLNMETLQGEVVLPIGDTPNRELTANPRPSVSKLTPGTKVRVLIKNSRHPAKFAQNYQGGWVVEGFLSGKRVTLIRNGGTGMRDRHIANVNDVAAYDPEESPIQIKSPRIVHRTLSEETAVETTPVTGKEGTQDEEEWQQLPQLPTHVYGTRAKTQLAGIFPTVSMLTVWNDGDEQTIHERQSVASDDEVEAGPGNDPRDITASNSLIPGTTRKEEEGTPDQSNIQGRRNPGTVANYAREVVTTPTPEEQLEAGGEEIDTWDIICAGCANVEDYRLLRARPIPPPSPIPINPFEAMEEGRRAYHEYHALTYTPRSPWVYIAPEHGRMNAPPPNGWNMETNNWDRDHPRVRRAVQAGRNLDTLWDENIV